MRSAVACAALPRCRCTASRCAADASASFLTADLPPELGSWLPEAGKPLWFCGQSRTHHLFFDDNIHYRTHDSIVAMRARPDPESPFQPLDGTQALAFHGSMLVKASILEAFLDEVGAGSAFGSCVQGPPAANNTRTPAHPPLISPTYPSTKSIHQITPHLIHPPTHPCPVG